MRAPSKLERLWNAKLEGVRREISNAKVHLFRAQDVASGVGDVELLEELRQARWRLEAADRRQADLREEAHESSG